MEHHRATVDVLPIDRRGPCISEKFHYKLNCLPHRPPEKDLTRNASLCASLHSIFIPAQLLIAMAASGPLPRSTT